MTTTNDANQLYICAVLERGHQLAKSAPPMKTKSDTAGVNAYLSAILEAIELWETGIQLGTSDAAMIEGLRTALAETAVRAGNAVQKVTDPIWEDKNWSLIRSNLNAAIEMLKGAYNTVKLESIEFTLIALYSDQANCQLRTEGSSSIAKAMEYVQEGLKLRPNDAKMKSMMGDCYLARFNLNMKNGNVSSAKSDLRKAQEYKDDPEIEQMVRMMNRL